ncbi:hypothetical protein [Siccirubricoccus sp. G192]|uniref:hypothetical protein n=1 Tax=Siccirubricoccus sp. G192 TaxID=2849651 RepID=UPI001C2BEED9|nr:hypothetical protein [Siccirubricoccus sp. G192]MBV1798778.1 hypothetical protein [Siccirubricoccus sp. G192]
MEQAKRRLLDVPKLLRLDPAVRVRCVTLHGLPEAADLDGQLRLEGLLCLLASQGITVACRARVDTGPGIWLGTGEPPRLGSPLLLWPEADCPASRLSAIAAQATGDAVLCVAEAGRLTLVRKAGIRGALLPDPAHALWGLLDQQPWGTGCLDLSPGTAWEALLPASRIRALARLQVLAESGLPLAGLLTLARRRLIEAARRLVVAHAEVASERVGPSLLAALLGRGIRATGEGRSSIAAYWAQWEKDEMANTPPKVRAA